MENNTGIDNQTLMQVEVAYATPQQQTILTVDAPQGVTIQDAIERSGVLAQFPEIDLTRNKVGVFGVAKKLNDVLRASDRVEIYRELIIDPKQARKNRLAKRKAQDAEQSAQ